MKKKKRTFTLLEIMIVILLITLITGTIGYNMKGTLDRGRAFRTEQAKEQLHDLLLICLAEKGSAEDIIKDPARSLKELGLAKDPEKLLKDGWNRPFKISANKAKNDFKIYSEALQRHKDKGRDRSSQNSEDFEEEP